MPQGSILQELKKKRRFRSLVVQCTQAREALAQQYAYCELLPRAQMTNTAMCLTSPGSTSNLCDAAISTHDDCQSVMGSLGTGP